MSVRPENRPSPAPTEPETANDRLKSSFGAWLWVSMIAATALHLAFFVLFPTMHAADVSYQGGELTAIDLPPEIEIPPPPEALARPATPIATADATVDEELTIAPTTFEDNPVEHLPPPPSGEEGDIASAPTFTPYTVAPELKNRREVAAALQREYPPMLRQGGMGGTVNVWFFIDEEGRVLDARIHRSSGLEALDQAALRVADLYEFTPALNRDQRVRVWVSLPITFRVR